MRVFFHKHYAASTPAPLALLIETAIRAMGVAAVFRRRLAMRGAAA
jgi:hypothetical protein